jgi:hypothetical protein
LFTVRGFGITRIVTGYKALLYYGTAVSSGISVYRVRGCVMGRLGRTGTPFVMGLLVGVLALGVGMAVAHSDGTEIRITAMRHEADGRIEFAVQEREGEGWGERVLPRARFFPASGREGRWLNSTPITVGMIDDTVSSTSTTDLVVTGFEWETSTHAFSGRIREVRGSAAVTNNTGALLTGWSTEMTCVDADNARAAAAPAFGWRPPLRHGESARVQFIDDIPSAMPTHCSLAFQGEVDLTAASSPSGSTGMPHLIIESLEWEAVPQPHLQVPDLTASAVVRNNTDETLSEWSAAMHCRDDNDSIVAYDHMTVSSGSGDAGALEAGESTRLEFIDLWPQGTPADCTVSFRGRIGLTH